MRRLVLALCMMIGMIVMLETAQATIYWGDRVGHMSLVDNALIASQHKYNES